jgi:hypothetical protein
MMTGWLKYWQLQKREDNIFLDYLGTYVQEMTYIEPPKHGEHQRT